MGTLTYTLAARQTWPVRRHVVFLAALVTVPLAASYGLSQVAPRSVHHPDAAATAAEVDRDPDVLAVAGASISYGVGAIEPADSWPVVLGHMLGWRVVVSADPGAGFVAGGARDGGPMVRLITRLDLARLHPDVVVVQAGFNDIGRPPAALRAGVQNSIQLIRAEAPDATIVLVTVFPQGKPTAATWRTDDTIVATAQECDPEVRLLDPLRSKWQFPRLGDHLHPTTAGHQWIASEVAAYFMRQHLVDRLDSHYAAKDFSDMSAGRAVGPR
jgi:acyl-CoA thioesterase I